MPESRFHVGIASRALGVAGIACTIASASEAPCDENVRFRGGVGASAGVGVISLRSEYPLSFGVVAPFEGRLGVQFNRVFGAYADGSLWRAN